ncbi:MULTISPECIES: MFS transporter [Rhizobium]|uniref:MFS family arabinose efflux permease n=1 Tax=Rhizobium tropici TaxID=398 RepID=A0A6P1C269_RHITR|nr:MULTISPECIES: MFS transporter [Rhizobium]AGB69999.1 major facilitator superfamily (MFS) transporter [Rhizobium tropici CIAT 899]MBB4239607.1 putative MFS family arabinose efflux permease [Rhizobium tropici]MBB5590877.1 putative MFS family arabinose efflux permease [Rhizobium tropici]MBB6489914.1 putative MFS family arabinose efflux permease [Rhizobium tropici]NEV09593.1 MFS transporter [Rhizobium tropici]
MSQVPECMTSEPEGEVSTAAAAPSTLLFAIATGVIILNLFAPQTLVGIIGPSLGFSESGAGLVAMASLLGYAAGLFFLVPLADLMENRQLVLRMLLSALVMAIAAAFAPAGWSLLIFLFLLGAACSAIQILVPIAAAMAPPEHRGRVIGNVMSGVMVGILVSRPLASLIADFWGWRSFYALSAATLALLAAVLALRLPERRPLISASYRALISSLFGLLREEPVLRLRAFTAALMMASFSLFWTSVALRLAQPPFSLGQSGIALFALVGAGGAAATSVFGRMGDRGWTRTATLASHLIVLAAMALAAWVGGIRSGDSVALLILLGVSAVLLDVGVTGDQTLGRRAVNLLKREARGRINGLFVGIFFLGGALGSALAGTAWDFGGWVAVCAGAAGFGVIALITGLAARI